MLLSEALVGVVIISLILLLRHFVVTSDAESRRGEEVQKDRSCPQKH